MGVCMSYYFFPYTLIKEHSKVVLWGAGKVGRDYYEQIQENNYCEIVLVVDKKYEDIIWNETSIHRPSDILDCEYDYIVISTGCDFEDSVRKDLKAMNVSDDKVIFCEEIYDETIEGEIVQEIFRLLQIDKPSYFDVGACRPHFSSNTMGLYLNGSRGVNVEANALLKKEFDIYRPKDTSVFIGIDITDGSKVFMKSDNPYLSTFSKGAAEWSEKYHGAKYIEEVKCDTITLNELSINYYDGRMPDYLDIDIEGLDEAVLEQVDFSNSSPIVICAEGYTPKLNEILINKKCEGGGYHPYCRYAANTIYVRKDKYKELMCLDK